MHSYDKEDYVVRDPNVAAWKTHANAHILRTYQHLIRGRVLDIGCNHGASGTYWLTENPNVTSIVGVDVQERARAAFETTMAEVTIPVEYVVTDFCRAPVPEALYDTVISFHTLEHIWPEDVNAFVQNVYAHLAVEGHFVISIPYNDNYKDSHHTMTFDVPSLTNLCESVGFTTIECMKDDRWVEKHLLTAVFRK